MPTEAKRQAVAALREQLAGSRTLIVSEYRGLTVREIGEFGAACASRTCAIRSSDRLLKIAAGDTMAAALNPLLTGPTAIAFGQDEGATAKAVMDTMRPYKTVRITGAVVGDRAIDADGVIRLASLPSRDVLLSQIAGAFTAPLATIAGLFDAPPARRRRADRGACRQAGGRRLTRSRYTNAPLTKSPTRRTDRTWQP